MDVCNDELFYSVVSVKKHSERINLERLYKILCHVEFLRRISFRLLETTNVTDYDWEDGYENVFFNITCENQKRALERIPYLLKLPFKHKGIMCAPLLSEIDIGEYLDSGLIEQVIVGGENYDGARPCHYEWVKKLAADCRKRNIRFCFIETGTVFVKEGKQYKIKSKDIQSIMAFKSGLNYPGKEIKFKLYDEFLNELGEDELYEPFWNNKCLTCGSKLICNGCYKCGKCK